MQITIPITVTVHFDIDPEDQENIDTQDLFQTTEETILDVIHQDIIADGIVEAITDSTGWCIRALSLSTPDMVD